MPVHYTSYAEYLKSHHWQVLKLSKILGEDAQCCACGSWDHVALHHMRYRRTFEETRLEDTCWLCKSCHKTFHLVIGKQMRRVKGEGTLQERTVRLIRNAKASAKRKAELPAKVVYIAVPQARKPVKASQQPSTFDMLIRQVKPRSALC